MKYWNAAGFFSPTSYVSWNNFFVITWIWHSAEDASWNILSDNLRNEIWARNHKNYHKISQQNAFLINILSGYLNGIPN